MAKCHIYFSIYMFFTQSFSQLVSLLFMRDESWAYCLSQNVVTTVSVPPPQRYLPQPLISTLVSLPLQNLVHNLPTSFSFTPGVQQHRTRVRRLPSSHLYSLTLPERYSYPHTLNTCTVFIVWFAIELKCLINSPTVTLLWNSSCWEWKLINTPFSPEDFLIPLCFSCFLL